MLDLEGKVILGGDLLEAIRSDKECPGKTKTLICRWLEKWMHNATRARLIRISQWLRAKRITRAHNGR